MDRDAESSELQAKERDAPATLVICDDHQLVAQGLRGLVEPPYRVAGVFYSADELLRALRSAGNRPDCLLLDSSMPGTNGIQALPSITAASPATKVIVVTMFSEYRVVVEECLRRGAHGFVPKDAGRDDLLRGIETVLAGGTYVSGRAGRIPGESPPPVLGLEHLTPRQIEILRLVAQALSPGQIGELLGLTAPTISTHLKLIRNCLGVQTQEALLKYALLLRLHETR